MGVQLRAQFKKSRGAWEMLETWNDWDKLLRRKSDIAPKTVGRGAHQLSIGRI